MAAWEAVKDAGKKAVGEKKEEPKTSQDFYLLGVDAYKKGDYKSAVGYFNKALELDPKNEKAKEGLEKAQQLLKGIEAKERSDIYLRGIEAYKNENYDLAAAYFYLARSTDEDAQENLEKAQKRGGNVDDGMAALRLQNLPPQLMQMVIAYYEKPKVVKAPPAPEEKKKEPTLFASIGGYDIRVDNKDIDRKTGIGKTNLDSYPLMKDFEKGKKTDWEKIIKDKCKGTYIGALVDKHDRTEGVFYIANGDVYLLTWERGGVLGDYKLYNGEWLKFKTQKLDGNGEYGIYVKKKEEPPTLTKLKKDFEEAGFV
ncbi:MAG: tetratricopeptide repeat protein [Candidatus Anstonellales archaeon]